MTIRHFAIKATMARTRPAAADSGFLPWENIPGESARTGAAPPISRPAEA